MYLSCIQLICTSCLSYGKLSAGVKAQPSQNRNHTDTHKHTHTHRHTDTRAHAYTYTHIHIHTHTHTHTTSHTHTHTHTYTHIHTHTHTTSYTHTTARRLLELQDPGLLQVFVKQSVVQALDRKDREKELVSLLLAQLHPEVGRRLFRARVCSQVSV